MLYFSLDFFLYRHKFYKHTHAERTQKLKHKTSLMLASAVMLSIS